MHRLYQVGDYVKFMDSEAEGLTGYVYDISMDNPHLLFVQVDGIPGKTLESPAWMITDEYVVPSSADLYSPDALLYYIQLAEHIKSQI